MQWPAGGGSGGGGGSEDKRCTISLPVIVSYTDFKRQHNIYLMDETEKGPAPLRIETLQFSVGKSLPCLESIRRFFG